MVKSKNYGFEVKILQKLNDDEMVGEIRNASYEPLRELMTPMGPYIVALPNQEFIIELRSNDYNVYGARLFIDEQEIFYKKTFKSKGYFMGFKLGGGKFSAFKFASPFYESQSKDATKLTKSEIRVEFYKTTERLVSKFSAVNNSIRKAQDEYIKGSVKDNKKFFRKSLTVEAGDVLYRPGLDKTTLFKKLTDERTHKIKDNQINYDAHLETITIHYGDFNALLVLGVMSLSNYDHLSAIPLSEIVEKPKVVERLLLTIIRRHNAHGINLRQIAEEFEKILRRPFEDLGVGSLVSFISTKHQLFHLDEKENLRCSETAKNIYLDLRDTNPDEGCIVPENYFKTGTENNLIRQKNDPKFCPKPLNPRKKGNASPIVIE